MPASIVLRLRARNAGMLPASNGYCVRSALLNLIESHDPPLARRLGGGGRKPATVSPLFGHFRHSRGHVFLVADEQYSLRVTTLSGDVEKAICVALDATSCLRLLDSTFALERVCTSSEEDRWAGTESYESLVSRTEGARGTTAARVGFEFVTPTAFEDEAYRKRVIALPIPERVFGALAKCWEVFAPPELRSYAAAAIGNRVLLRRHHIQTHMLDFGDKGRQLGFVGHAEFQAPDDSSEADLRAIQLLAGFSFYSGVGDRTMWGMGQVRTTSARLRVCNPIDSAM